MLSFTQNPILLGALRNVGAPPTPQFVLSHISLKTCTKTSSANISEQYRFLVNEVLIWAGLFRDGYRPEPFITMLFR